MDPTISNNDGRRPSELATNETLKKLLLGRFPIDSIKRKNRDSKLGVANQLKKLIKALQRKRLARKQVEVARNLRVIKKNLNYQARNRLLPILNPVHPVNPD